MRLTSSCSTVQCDCSGRLFNAHEQMSNELVANLLFSQGYGRPINCYSRPLFEIFHRKCSRFVCGHNVMIIVCLADDARRPLKCQDRRRHRSRFNLNRLSPIILMLSLAICTLASKHLGQDAIVCRTVCRTVSCDLAAREQVEFRFG